MSQAFTISRPAVCVAPYCPSAEVAMEPLTPADIPTVYGLLEAAVAQGPAGSSASEAAMDAYATRVGFCSCLLVRRHGKSGMRGRWSVQTQGPHAMGNQLLGLSSVIPTPGSGLES